MINASEVSITILVIKGSVDIRYIFNLHTLEAIDALETYPCSSEYISKY